MQSIKNTFNKLSYFLDKQDKKNYIKLLMILGVSAILSVLGLGVVVPFVTLLLNPEQMPHIPLISQMPFHQMIVVVGMCLVLMFILKNIVLYGAIYYQNRFVYRLVAKLQKRLFSGYMAMPYSEHVKRNSASLIKNLNTEVDFMARMYILPTAVLINDSFLLLAIYGFMLYLNFLFTFLISFFFTILFYIITKLTKRKVSYIANKRGASLFDLTFNAVQALGGIKETIVYNKAQVFEEGYSKAADGFTKASAWQLSIAQLPRFMLEAAAISVMIVFVLIFIILDYSTEEIMVLLSVFGVAAFQAIPSLYRIMMSYFQIKNSSVAVKLIKDELNNVEQNIQAYSVNTKNRDSHAYSLGFKNKLVLNNISFSYSSNKEVLSNVSLSIEKSKKIAFVGASGAGKTTLVDIILGLYQPSQGDMHLDDVKIDQNNIQSYHKLFGYIPQVIYIFDCTIKENIAFGCKPEEIDEEQVWRCLELADLKEFVFGLNEQLNSFVGEQGLQLSGGQRQRLGIARALYQNPKILIMDEATAALDNKTEANIVKALEKASEYRTLITIAHRLSTVEDYDCIYMFDKGCVVAHGTYNQLLNDSDEFKKMVNV